MCRIYIYIYTSKMYTYYLYNAGITCFILMCNRRSSILVHLYMFYRRIIFVHARARNQSGHFFFFSFNTLLCNVLKNY